jgi:hypothetical protein
MILGYAPKHENNTSRYLKFPKDKTGVKDGRKIKDFAPEEFEKLWRAIETYEGIELARRGELDAVVAISSAGNLYLRTRPGI